MNQIDKLLIEYAKLHLQLVISQESIQKLSQENLELQAKIQRLNTPDATDATTVSTGE